MFKKFKKKINNFFENFFVEKKEILCVEKISLKDKNLFDLKIESFVDYQKIKNKYQKLTNKYSKKIIKNKLLISVNDVKTLNTEKYDIEIRNLSKYFLIERKVNNLFFNLNLKIEKGDFVVFLGPSGSGKTSLLNIMAGLDTPDTGDVIVKGYNLTFLKNTNLTQFRRENIGLIFQRYNLLQNLTARENVEIGANLLPKWKETIDIDEILSVLEIKQLANSFVYQLSGGEQQRFSIARALAKNPCILFCDEPTGALDEKTSQKVIDALLEINKKYKTTVILITHDERITKIAKTIVRIQDGNISLVKNNCE